MLILLLVDVLEVNAKESVHDLTAKLAKDLHIVIDRFVVLSLSLVEHGTSLKSSLGLADGKTLLDWEVALGHILYYLGSEFLLTEDLNELKEEASEPLAWADLHGVGDHTVFILLDNLLLILVNHSVEEVETDISLAFKLFGN